MTEDPIVPEDYANLGDWAAFAWAAFGPESPAFCHLEELCDTFGKLYEVEFTAEEFLHYLSTLNYTYLSEAVRWEHWRTA